MSKDSFWDRQVQEKRCISMQVASVPSEEVQWLWPGRIALGKLTIIAGDPGLGKSFLTLGVAATVSRGGYWPDNRQVQAEVGSVILLSAEDGVGDTIRPRLEAAGADTTKIHCVQGVSSTDEQGEYSRAFDMRRDLDELEELVFNVDDCRLVIVDPMSAYLGESNTHQDSVVRSFLAPLASMAARNNVAIVIVSHLRKSEGLAIHRTMGSLGFVAAARTAHVVVEDQDDPERRLFLPIKNNLASNTGGLSYRLKDHGYGAVITWDPDPISITADEAFRRSTTGKSGESREKVDPVEWLEDYLSEGPRLANDIKEAAKGVGIGRHKLDRAVEQLAVKREKTSPRGPWQWELPGSSASRPNRCDPAEDHAPSVPETTVGSGPYDWD